MFILQQVQQVDLQVAFNAPSTHLGLAVVLQRHGDDIDADDEGDDQV